MPKPFASKPDRPVAGAPLSGRPLILKRVLTYERGLGIAGLALALASGSFASYMISDTGRQPHFSGAEYLTVFAKLAPTQHKGVSPSDEPDDISTATVSNAAFAADATGTSRTYVLRSVTQGTALIESPEGLREVRPGAILPNLGLVSSIELRQGRWVVVTSRGLIREARR
jgi:hypothetical protein